MIPVIKVLEDHHFGTTNHRYSEPVHRLEPWIQAECKSLDQIHANAKSYDRLVNDQHYLMKTEIIPERACLVQFTTEQGNVITTNTFFNAVVSEEAK